MKVNRLLVRLIIKGIENRSKKNIKKTNFDVDYAKYDINYLNDDSFKHAFDIYYANKDDRLDKTMIDIHGGAYARGNRKDNFYFASYFKDEGIDVVVPDYITRVENKNFSVKQEIKDLVAFINYLDKHYEDLNLSKNIYLCGDSAGGHFALILAEMFNNNALAKRFDLEVENLKLKAVLLNCPAYDFKSFSTSAYMTDNAKLYLFGNNILNEDYAQSISPLTYIKDLKTKVFLSSCKNDLLKEHCNLLDDTLTKLNNNHVYHYLDKDDKRVGHVHNVINLELEESKFINNEMIKFMEEN
ncbi:MAG: alpha/beta hydrolase [Gammaproteobacteria bacterium]|nr:alpha/beta hydrolase [Gammaproteobacteria bacterium]